MKLPNRHLEIGRGFNLQVLFSNTESDLDTNVAWTLKQPKAKGCGPSEFSHSLRH